MEVLGLWIYHLYTISKQKTWCARLVIDRAKVFSAFAGEKLLVSQNLPHLLRSSLLSLGINFSFGIGIFVHQHPGSDTVVMYALVVP